MKRIPLYVLLIGFLAVVGISTSALTWGFFGHRWINRMAVFTLPSDLIGVYKQNLEFVTEHAVDPDKRRYATKHEAVRHYIDIDKWGVYPFDSVPRKWTDALAQQIQIICITNESDSTVVFDASKIYWGRKDLFKDEAYRSLRLFTLRQVLPQYYEDEWRVSADTVRQYISDINCGPCTELVMEEHFSEHGILPYHLLTMQRRLTRAFEDKNIAKIMRTSAEMGHYIGDAHVPLHTTVNYNGQLTNQLGIHAFWESRIPELFAKDEYDFWVGQAEYIDDPAQFFWDVVLKSHSYLDEVLNQEKRLSEELGQDELYSFDDRLGRTIRTQSRSFSEAYQNSMDGMVEERMRESVHALGSLWYTAWVDAGQPNLDIIVAKLSDSEQRELEELEAKVRGGVMKGRKHE